MILDYQVRTVQRLLTPDHLLQRSQLPEAAKILPDTVLCFEDLLKRRDDIRYLRWLPVKTNEDRAAYKQVNQEEELEALLEQMGSSRIALCPNKYPYLLPPDVEQSIIWVQSEAEASDVLLFIADLLLYYKLIPERVICFERPPRATTPLVKGTFPLLRHLHFWVKNEHLHRNSSSSIS